MVHVGILSDTHISKISTPFQQQVQQAFKACQVIVHAGDLTDVSILDAFKDKDCYCVCGNMCSPATKQQLPTDLLIELEGYRIGVTHGHIGYRNLEHNLLSLFPTADCIVFGHTHQPFCQELGDVLFLNPGTFRSTSPYGAPGTYAILQIETNGLQAAIHQLSLGL